MKLHESNIATFLRHFLNDIESAAFSWRMISLELEETDIIDSGFFQKLYNQALTDSFENTECHLFRIRNGRLLLIFFQGRAKKIESCIENFLRAIHYKDISVSFDILDLSIEWQTMLNLVQKLFPDQNTSTSSQPVPPIDFKDRSPEPKPISSSSAGLTVTLDPAHIESMHKKNRSSRIKPVVMLVEDDPLFQKLVKVSLPEYNIIIADTAWQSLIYYQRYLPDLLFLDINLPDGNGLSILKNIVDADPYSYVVMISADTMKDKIVMAQERGAKTFVGKPFTRKRLLDVVAEFIQKRRKQR